MAGVCFFNQMMRTLTRMSIIVEILIRICTIRHGNLSQHKFKGKCFALVKKSELFHFSLTCIQYSLKKYPLGTRGTVKVKQNKVLHHIQKHHIRMCSTTQYRCWISLYEKYLQRKLTAINDLHFLSHTSIQPIT